MWSLYAPHHGVAVKSSVGRLIQALQATQRPIEIGTVHYMDFGFPTESDSEFWLYPEFVKRKSFEHERELRALTIDTDVYRSKGTSNEITGVGVDIDVAALLDAVYVAPTLEGWIKDVVKTELKSHCLPDVRVIHSTLYSESLR